MEIANVIQLCDAVRNSHTGGYNVDFEIQPNREQFRAGDGFWLVIEVRDSEPDSEINGQWWFDATGEVMQVL